MATARALCASMFALAFGQLVSLDAVAQARDRSVRVLRPPLVESLNPVEVNALARKAIYGLTLATPPRPIDFPARGNGDPTMYVDGLNGSETFVCVELIRAQGGYRASFQTEVPRGTGRVAIPFDSADEVRRYLNAHRPTEAELTIRARPGRRGQCKEDAPLLSAGWSAAPTAPTLWLAVGAAGKGVPSVRINLQPPQRCREIGQLLGRPDLGANVFGFQCPVEFVAPACKIENTATVLWMEGGTVADQVDIHFRRNCG